MSNNPPFSVIELTEEQHKFLLRNCELNLQQSLKFLSTLQSRDLAEELVNNIESFKQIKSLLEKSRGQL